MIRRVSALAAAVLCVAACSSDPRAGYSFESPFPAGVSSVHVPMFVNTTPNPGQEVLLTEAVIKEIRRTAGWNVVQSPTADTTLTATLVASDLRVLSNDSRTGLVQELAVRMVVDFEWRDNRTGQVLVARRGFAGTDTFIPARGVGERLEVGQFAAAQDLARGIVAELRSAW